MKITKRQLRRIIREERQRLLAENHLRRRIRRSLMREMGFHEDDELDEEDLEEISPQPIGLTAADDDPEQASLDLAEEELEEFPKSW